MDGKLLYDFFEQKLYITVGKYELELSIYQVPVIVKEALKMIENDEVPTLEEICKRLSE